MKIPKGRAFELKFFDQLVDWRRIKSRVDFGESITQVLFKQPNNWNPLAPHTPMARDLLDEVRKSVYEQSYMFREEDRLALVANIGLYCSLGAALDFIYKTDGFFCCDLGWRHSPIVTIDLKSGDSWDDPELEDHFIVTEHHFAEVKNGRKRMCFLAGAIAERIVYQANRIFYREALAS